MCWSRLAKHWPNSTDIGRTFKCGPKLAKFSHKFGQFWSSSAKIGQSWSEICHLSAKYGQHRPVLFENSKALTNVGPFVSGVVLCLSFVCHTSGELVQFGQTSANTSPNLLTIRPKLVQNKSAIRWPTSANLGRSWAESQLPELSVLILRRAHTLSKHCSGSQTSAQVQPTFCKVRPTVAGVAPILVEAGDV